MYISENDKAAIRQIIEQQLQALQTNDAEIVLSLMSPSIQGKFEPRDFMAMVQNKYHAIIKPRSIMFRGFTLVNNFPALISMIMDQRGELIQVIFVVQHQQDYSWRIHGYELLTADEKIV